MNTMDFTENNQTTTEFMQDKVMFSDIESDSMQSSVSDRRWKTLKITSLLR